MDTNNRLFFKGNPFPQGHPVKTFSWNGAIDPQRGLIFHFHLVTEDYNVEDESDDVRDDLPDWQSKTVWNNYHSCMLSSKAWGNEGILAGTETNPFDFDQAFPAVFSADPLPLDEDWDPDDLAFGIYLFGHDSTAGHRIEINRLEGNSFNLNWTGKIALTYAGEEDFDYEFEVNIGPVSFDGIHYPKEWSQEQALTALSKVVADPAPFVFEDLNPKSFKREYQLAWRP